MGTWRFPDVPGAPPAREDEAAPPKPVAAPEEEPAKPAQEEQRAPEPQTDVHEAAPPPPVEAPPTPAPAPKRRMKRVLSIVAGVLGVVLLGTAVWVAVRLQPWLRMPSEPTSEIDARWKVVQRLAAAPPSRDDSVLLEATEKVGSSDLKPASEPVPSLLPSELSEEQRQAIELLVSWHRARGGYGAPECSADVTRRGRAALPSYRLGKAALYTAGGIGAMPQVEAVLAMATELRRGGKLVELAIGASLAEMAAEWSRARGVMFPPHYERYRPRVDDIRGALARDAACTLKLVDSMPSRSFSIYDGRLGEAGERPPFGIVRMERERLVFKQFHGRVLNEALAAGDDWKRIANVYRRAAEQRPKSVLLEATALSGSVIDNVGRSISRYDEIVPRR